MAPKAPEGKFCPLCTPALSLNPSLLTLTPTPTLSLVLILPLALALTRAMTLARTEYWDRAGGESNISCECKGTQRMIQATFPQKPPSEVH